MRRCPRCKVEKSAEDFYKNQWDCKSCQHESRRAWTRANPERQAQRKRESYLRYRDERIAKSIAWWHANRERRRIYEHENRHIWAAVHARRRARIRANGVVPYNRMDIYERDDGICHLCGEFVEYRDMSMDHLVPICDGGPDSPDNVALAHRWCNVKRGRKPLEVVA